MLEAEAEKHSSTFRSLLESTPQAVLACDLKGVITFVNRRVESMFGYAASELLGIPMEVLVPESSRQIHAERHQVYFQDIQTRPMGSGLTMTGRRKDATTFPVEIALSGTEIDGEKNAVAFISDITERRNAEIALERSELQYRHLFDNMQEGVAYCRVVEEPGVGPDIRYISVNKRFEEITGTHDVPGKTLTDLIPSIREQDPLLLEAFCRVAASGVPETLEYFLASSRDWLFLSLYCPEPGYLVIIFQKITDRKIADEAIRRSETQIRLALENTRMGTFEFDIRTGKRSWSAISKSFLGLPPEAEMDEAAIDARIHPDDLANLRGVFNKALHSDGSGDYAFDFRTTEVAGPMRWISAWGKILRDANGKQERAVGVMLDVTERKRLALALQESHTAIRALAARLLTAQEEERRSVARDLHDHVCQQLAALAIDLAGISANPGPSKGIPKRLNTLHSRIVRAAEETRQIAYQMHPSILDDLGLVPSLKDLCRDYSVRHPETAFTFRETLNGATIPRDLGTCIYRTAQQGLQNVVEHAGAKHASVTLAVEAGMVTLCVIDDGVGFRPAAPNGRHQLGLVSLRERASLVGGIITIAANPEGGTELCLRVPLLQPPPVVPSPKVAA